MILLLTHGHVDHAMGAEEFGEVWMSPLDREIFLRHYYYAQTVKEVALQMGMKESTVKTRLKRGRVKLKETLMREGFAHEA